jgi:hypothetical protein
MQIGPVAMEDEGYRRQPEVVGTNGSRYDNFDGEKRMEPETRKHSDYEIDIEGALYAWCSSTITVEQLRELAGYPAGTEMIEVDLETNTERTLREDEIIRVEPGKGFGKKVLFKRG